MNFRSTSAAMQCRSYNKNKVEVGQEKEQHALD